MKVLRTIFRKEKPNLLLSHSCLNTLLNQLQLHSADFTPSLIIMNDCVLPIIKHWGMEGDGWTGAQRNMGPAVLYLCITTFALPCSGTRQAQDSLYILCLVDWPEVLGVEPTLGRQSGPARWPCLLLASLAFSFKDQMEISILARASPFYQWRMLLHLSHWLDVDNIFADYMGCTYCLRNSFIG